MTAARLRRVEQAQGVAPETHRLPSPLVSEPPSTEPQRRQRVGRRAGASAGSRRRSCASAATSRTRTASTARTRSPRCDARWGALETGSETGRRGRPSPAESCCCRDTGKLVFATIRDRDGQVQLFVSKGVIGDDVVRRREGARPRRLGRRPRHGHDDAHRRAVDQGRSCAAARQGGAPAARQVARALRPRHPLPAALRRPDRQRGSAPRVRDPARHRSPASDARSTPRASSRSRRRCCTPRPAAPTRGRSRPITTRWRWTSTSGSRSSCTSSG